MCTHHASMRQLRCVVRNNAQISKLRQDHEPCKSLSLAAAIHSKLSCLALAINKTVWNVLHRQTKEAVNQLILHKVAFLGASMWLHVFIACV